MRVSKSRKDRYHRQLSYEIIDRSFSAEKPTTNVKGPHKTPLLEIKDLQKHGLSKQQIADDLYTLNLEKWLYLLD